MGWVLSMAVVEGLRAEKVAARLDKELAEETVGYSLSGEEAEAGLGGLPAVGMHGDGRAVILDDPYDDAPPLEDTTLLARLSRATRVVLFQLSERVNCGFFQVGCWTDGIMAWQITHCREEPETEEYQILGVPPGIFAAKAAPYRAQQAQADADDGSGDNRKHPGDDYLGEEESRNLRGKLLRVVLALGGPASTSGK